MANFALVRALTKQDKLKGKRKKIQKKVKSSFFKQRALKKALKKGK